MNKLYYSPEAMSDLDEIWNYINKDLQNPAAARNTVEGIMDTIDKLKESSEIGPSLAVITEFESDCSTFFTASMIVRTGKKR